MTIRVTDKDLMEQLRSGPEGQRLLKEREEALQDQRQRQAAELTELRKELDRGLPDLAAKAENARERFQKAHAARMEALQECAAADRERSTFAAHLGRRIEGLEAELRRSASRQIAEFIGGQVLVDEPQGRGLVLTRRASTGLEGEIERTQAAPLIFRINRESGESIERTNQAELSARLRAIRAAQAKAAALMLEALTAEEIAERLQAIQAEIPGL